MFRGSVLILLFYSCAHSVMTSSSMTLNTISKFVVQASTPLLSFTHTHASPYVSMYVYVFIYFLHRHLMGLWNSTSLLLNSCLSPYSTEPPPLPSSVMSAPSLPMFRSTSLGSPLTPLSHCPLATPLADLVSPMFTHIQNLMASHYLPYFHAGPSHCPPSPGWLQQPPAWSGLPSPLASFSLFLHSGQIDLVKIYIRSCLYSAQYPAMASYHPENEVQCSTKPARLLMPGPQLVCWFHLLSSQPSLTELSTKHAPLVALHFLSLQPGMLLLWKFTWPVPYLLQVPVQMCQPEWSSMSTIWRILSISCPPLLSYFAVFF